MTDPLINDVKALLDKEKGDELILKQIFRACQNNEVISNYERNYVRKLAEKYLAKKPEIEQPLETVIIPDVISSPPSINQKIESIKTQVPKKSNNKILFGVSAIIITVVISVLSITGIFNSYNEDNLNSPLDSIPLSIQTDLSDYQKGDIISINGRSKTPGTINLTIENEQGQLVWSEQAIVKSNGRYSTLAIAGGIGWENPGTFIIIAENGSETESKTFSFSG